MVKARDIRQALRLCAAASTHSLTVEDAASLLARRQVQLGRPVDPGKIERALEAAIAGGDLLDPDRLRSLRRVVCNVVSDLPPRGWLCVTS